MHLAYIFNSYHEQDCFNKTCNTNFNLKQTQKKFKTSLGNEFAAGL